MILVHMLVLLPQSEELFEEFQPLRLHLPGIHQFLVVLPPRAHIALLRNEFGGFALISLEEVNRLLPARKPEFVLGHTATKIVFFRDSSKWKYILLFTIFAQTRGICI